MNEQCEKKFEEQVAEQRGLALDDVKTFREN